MIRLEKWILWTNDIWYLSFRYILDHDNPCNELLEHTCGDILLRVIPRCLLNWRIKSVTSSSMNGVLSPGFLYRYQPLPSHRKVLSMTMSSNGNIFSVTGPLCGEFTSHRWIHLIKASGAALWFFLICTWINGWVNNREAGGLRCHRTRYHVTVMELKKIQLIKESGKWSDIWSKQY